MTQPPQGGGPPDLQNLFAQAQRLQQQMMEAQERAKRKSVEASAGGGMVTAEMNGGLELVSLKIDPSVIDPKDVGMLQDLIIAAVNQALVKAQAMMQGEVQQLAGGLMPGLF